jgi:hypothetical protein
MEAGDRLSKLVELLRKRHSLDEEISKLIGRHADKGPIGEFIASEIFGIKLHESGSHKGSDGVFRSGKLTGRSVNVKMYTDGGYGLDIKEKAIPDYYLVLSGSTPSLSSTAGEHPSLIIESVYLFDSSTLIPKLRRSGVKIGEPTSVKKEDWESAEIYPRQRNLTIELAEKQRKQLDLFRA